MVREPPSQGEFIEIVVDTPTSVSDATPSAPYRKALAGEIGNFSGIDQPYEPPEPPELMLARIGETAEQAALRVISYLLEPGRIDRFDDLGKGTI